MNVTVRRIPAADSGQLEAKLNQYLSAPANSGSSVAAAFPAADGDIIVIFQRPALAE